LVGDLKNMSKESEKIVENLLKEINEKLAQVCEIVGIKQEKAKPKNKKSSSYNEAYKKSMAIYEKGNEYIKNNTK